MFEDIEQVSGLRSEDAVPDRPLVAARVPQDGCGQHRHEILVDNELRFSFQRNTVHKHAEQLSPEVCQPAS